MPGDYYGGSGTSGFTSDADGAEATLNVSMSDDSARNLWDVQAAIQQIAVDFQTAVRSAADFNSYLISIRETSQTVKMPSLGMEGGEGGNMGYGGGRVDTLSVPGGGVFAQSEATMADRIGEMEENASGAGGGAMAARGTGGGTRPFDAGEAVSQLTNIAWMASMVGGHGGAPAETQAAYQREYEFAQNNPRDPGVRRAQFAGQQGTPRAFAASRILSQGLPAAQQFLGGAGAGGIAAALGRLGAAGAVAYGAYQLYNAGAETYAQSRALGISTLNSDYGSGWGFQQRFNQAEMAFSPFVSQADAAQIYGSAVDQGWASRKGGFAQGDFSQAVNFMYGAAKDYNMSPEMSAQLLQTNSMGAGESVAALSEQLLTLKKTLDGTGVSMDSASSSFTSFTSFLIGNGATPGDAALIAGGAIKSFSGNSYLAQGAGVASVQAGMASPSIQAIVGGLTGQLPNAAFAGANVQKGTAAYQQLIHQLAVQWSSQTGLSHESQVSNFMTAYQTLTRQSINYKEAEEIMAEAQAPDFITRGQADVKKASTLGDLQDRGTLTTAWNWLNKDLFNIHGTAGYQNDMGAVNALQTYSPQVNNILQSAGDKLNQVKLYDGSGKVVQVAGHDAAGSDIAWWMSNQQNFNKFKDVNSGYYIQDASGNKYNSQNIGLGGSSAGVTGGGANDNNTLYITLSDQAKQLINTNKDKFTLDSAKN